MSDNKPALPDRLAANPRSPHHVAECFQHEIGIRVNGKERANVEEYCISEGWVKIPSPKAKDRYGNPMLFRTPALRRCSALGPASLHRWRARSVAASAAPSCIEAASRQFLPPLELARSHP